jgi:shikimate dehydrogenase
LGTFPKVEEFPLIPYEGISTDHLLYDLVYNPARTMFLQKGEARGAIVMNGSDMLVLQAEAAWEIWNR